MDGLSTGLAICRMIESAGHSPVGKSFLEVGTGRVIATPLAFWLCGARRIVTVDVNPYLKAELVREDLNSIALAEDSVRALFGTDLVPERLTALSQLVGRKSNLRDLLHLTEIEYLAPADATDLALPARSIDYHVSNSVLEHIPPDVIRGILLEGNRVLKESGLFVHRVDFSDHFAHSDPSISRINFLQFGDDEWERICGNRFMYMNRLRFDDFLELFRVVEHDMLLSEPCMEPEIREVLSNADFKLDNRFLSKSTDTLSIMSSWFVSQHERI